MNDVAAMTRLIEALRPWSTNVVIIGGWAHRLHRLHPDATPPAYQPIVTLDADVALEASAQLSGNIGDALKTAGFNENFSSDQRPPISRYTLGTKDESSGFYAEFLTPLRGSGVRRNGTDDATMAMNGITAQKLRDLDVLLVAPWTLHLEPGGEFGVQQSTTVRVTNPVSFIAQKLLIHAQRRRPKKAQDVLYINDTLELFARRMDDLRSYWINHVRPSLTSTQTQNIEQARADIFESTTDTIRAAALISPIRRLSTHEIQQRCSLVLSELLAE
jgi:hypothetical protein